METLLQQRFANINLDDAFFDSLKTDYTEFASWFERKRASDEMAYVMYDERENIQAFLYLKQETDEITDVEPRLPAANRLKVGTFKVNPHGTRLGERFIKKIFDNALSADFEEAYLTIFEKHQGLVNLLKAYGFVQYGEKVTNNGTELVLIKNLKRDTGNNRTNYPRFKTSGKNKWLLAIYPGFHTRLFPDSILNNESFDIIKDVSHTNSIHKIYVTKMNVGGARPGDLIMIYRTSDGQAPARFRSVVTSVCVVEEIRAKGSFQSLEEYLRYCQPYSIFDTEELTEWYHSGRIFVIKMLYNAAFGKRLTRGHLIDNVGISDNLKWSFIRISDSQFDQILTEGKINESLVID